MSETLSSGDVCTKLRRVAHMAREHPERVFRSIHHVIDIAWLREAYRRTRKEGAVGVDGQTASEYAGNLEGNLEALLDRLTSGSYRAPPVRRVHIPKRQGRKTRPIGIPTFEDKVLQHAVTMALTAIYEQDFVDSSFAFRPGRSAHDALAVLRSEVMSMAGGWVLEVDVVSFFDTLDHGHLRRFLDRRVTDGVVRRVMHKWLHAGVMEQGPLSYPESGSPRGGVISPLLAASLAWSLKAWAALLLPISPRWRMRHLHEQRQLLRMDFRTFVNAIINIPAQVVRTGRSVVLRLLGASPQLDLFFRLLDGIAAVT